MEQSPYWVARNISDSRNTPYFIEHKVSSIHWLPTDKSEGGKKKIHKHVTANDWMSIIDSEKSREKVKFALEQA